jgi:hypothetical protein
MTIKNKALTVFLRLTNIDLYPVSSTWDKKLNEVLDILEKSDDEDLRKFSRGEDRSQDVPFHALNLYGYNIWLSNFPYAFGYLLPGGREDLDDEPFPKAMPRMGTRVRLAGFLMNRLGLMPERDGFILPREKTEKEKLLESLSRSERREKFIQEQIEKIENNRNNVEQN